MWEVVKLTVYIRREMMKTYISLEEKTTSRRQLQNETFREAVLVYSGKVLVQMKGYTYCDSVPLNPFYLSTALHTWLPLPLPGQDGLAMRNHSPPPPRNHPAEDKWFRDLPTNGPAEARFPAIPRTPPPPPTSPFGAGQEERGGGGGKLIFYFSLYRCRPNSRPVRREGKDRYVTVALTMRMPTLFIY